MYDVLVIGAGPAGLTAAIYARRYGHTVAVLERLIYGGQVANTPDVENYPAIARITGADFATNLYTQAMDLGAQVLFEEVLSATLEGEVKSATTSSGTHRGRTLIIANGAQRRKLGCPGEERFAGRGVSYCATCDGAFYRDQEVAIVGGGNTALEDALFLANLCSKVHLIHRRNQFRGNPILSQALLQKENIQVHYDTAVDRILGETAVQGLELRDLKTQERTTLPVRGVFVAIGLAPENQMFQGALSLDEAGYLVADESCQTSIPGVFVAGDTRRKALRQIVTATSDGAMAAFGASNFLNQLQFQGCARETME